MIKSGQKLWVKAEIGAYEHKIGDMCIVIGVYKGVKYPVCVEFDGKQEDYSYAEIEKYFYDKARWREQQINSILDDN